jgi:hypothetical protein
MPPPLPPSPGLPPLPVAAFPLILVSMIVKFACRMPIAPPFEALLPVKLLAAIVTWPLPTP